ncbi:MAG: acyl-CoA dehydrogenase N-terminal domain-containing protein, partial [Pseudomonadota bacterium]
MTTYTAPLDDMKFVLNNVLQISKYSNLAGFSDLSDGVLEAILEEGGKLAANVLHPINHAGDKQGCTRHEDGSV